MKYALGNMLNGAGGLNADGLSLDLQFATDKTLTARKGPTPVFTRASSGTFVGSDGLIQSAAINAARFDHDPITLVCKGLLIEEQRTNLCLRSEEFNNAVWQGAVQTPTISTDFAVSPDGTQNAERLQWTVVNGRLQQTFSPSVSTNYTFSVWLKSNTGSNQIVELFLYFGVGGTNYGEAKTVTPNWQRFTVTASSIVVAAGAVFQIRSSQSTTDILAWGAQLEAGSFATSYIPTTTASVVRSADVCSITGSDFTSFYSTTGSTFFSEFDSSISTGEGGVAALDGTGGESCILSFFAAEVWSATQAVDIVVVSSPARTANVFKKIASSEDPVANNLSLSYGGSDAAFLVTSNNSALFSGLRIGKGFSNFNLNGHIKFLRHYKKALSNSKIKLLTTP